MAEGAGSVLKSRGSNKIFVSIKLVTDSLDKLKHAYETKKKGM
jgi:hypothetical protein